MRCIHVQQFVTQLFLCFISADAAGVEGEEEEEVLWTVNRVPRVSPGVAAPKLRLQVTEEGSRAPQGTHQRRGMRQRSRGGGDGSFHRGAFVAQSFGP